MNRIVTVTLNPSIDKSTKVATMVPEQKLRCERPKFEPGGGGINVSRAIKKLGGEATSVFLAGGHSGHFLVDLIKKEGINYINIPIVEQTRENLIVVESTSNNQYRFGMEGPSVSNKEWQNCLDTVDRMDHIDYLVGSGSLAPGIPTDFYGRMARIAKNKGARFVLDTSGEALAIAANEGVYLLKPNLGELSALSGVEELHTNMVEEKAMEIIEKGNCEVIVVSLGPAGALLVSKGAKEQIPSPTVKKLSTVGAGDSMVGGIVLSLSLGKTLREAVRYGVACGTSATMNPGTELCKKEDVEVLYKWINEQLGV